jgi:hypothetical protein
MIIRSQDKKKIATLDKCKATESGEVFVNGAFFGNYSTEAKAIKVLDMIQEAYCKEKVNDVISSGLGEILGNCKEDIGTKFIEECRSQHYFQMPQDCEV